MLSSTFRAAALLFCAAHAAAFLPAGPSLGLRARPLQSAVSSNSMRSVGALSLKAQAQTTVEPATIREIWTKDSVSKVDSTGLKSGDKVGILFLNLGGPESLDEVEDFLFNLFNDEDIIRLPNVFKPLQGFIARNVAKRRAPGSREAYESIGGGSPIMQLTQDQGDKLAEELKKQGVDAKVYIGMRYWYPFTEQAVDNMLADGINRLVVLPLYPQVLPRQTDAVGYVVGTISTHADVLFGLRVAELQHLHSIPSLPPEAPSGF